MRLPIATVALALLLSPGVATASPDECQRLLAKGLVEFHAARYPAALPLFEQAVAADAANTDALYYRGVTHGRLDQFDAAIADLRALLAAQPDHPQATLDLGAALVQSGANDEAIPLLERARRNPDQKTQATFLLGVAQLRTGDFANARTNLDAAAAADPALAMPARYYRGVAAYQASDWQQAEEDFGYVSSVSPASEMGRESKAFLARLQQPRAGGANRLLYVDLGFQYDSNVVLAPSDNALQDSLGISDEADGRATIIAGALWAPWRNEHAELSLGYEFFQSLHFDLTDFNLQDHRPLLQLTVQAGPVRAGLAGLYHYYLLDTEPFLQEPTALPWIQFYQGNFGRAEANYHMRYRDYRVLPYNGLRDAFNHAIELRQYVYLGAPERYLWAGYQFDREDSIHGAGDMFAYDGHQGAGGVGWALPYAITSEVSYRYRHEDYDSASDGRDDDEHRVVVLAQKGLTDHLLLTLGYMGTFNDSNEADFEYDRHVVSLSLGARF